MSEEQVSRDYGRAHERFAEIFGRPAHCSAAPGWHATATSLAVQERYHLRYASNTRGGTPCFPEALGRRFETLEIPTTLPTWDETLNAPEFANEAAFIDHYRRSIRGTEVHSIHTEVEGVAYADLFRRQLEAWVADGVGFVAMETIAAEALATPERVPVRRIVRTTLPGRAGKITSSVA
jgi:peptidoglycan/xylan/chitin deacetylase (PgdA/CDA1 family)